MKFALVVVPVEIDANVLFGIFVDLERVFELHDGGKMLQILGVRVDAKIINKKSKGNVTGTMEEESFCLVYLDVPMCCKMLYEVITGNFSGLLEPIPGTVDFCINVFVVT